MDRPENELPDRERPDRAEPEELRDWEEVQTNGDEDHTERLAILGGWLYRSSTPMGLTMVFVPHGEKSA